MPLSYLKQARQFIENCSYEEATEKNIKHVANSYYNVGIKFYNMEDYQQAIEPIANSCDLLRTSLGKKDPAELSAVKLSKRYSILAFCLQRTGDIPVRYTDTHN